MGGGAKVGTQSISKRWLVRHTAVLWQPAGALCHRPRQVLGHETVEVNIAARNQQDHLCGPCVASDPLCPRPEHFGRIVAEQVKTSN